MNVTTALGDEVFVYIAEDSGSEQTIVFDATPSNSDVRDVCENFEGDQVHVYAVTCRVADIDHAFTVDR